MILNTHHLQVNHLQIGNLPNLLQSLETHLNLVNRTSLLLPECCLRMHLLLHLFQESLQILHRLKDRMKLKKPLNLLNLLSQLILLLLLAAPLEIGRPLITPLMNPNATVGCGCLVDP